MNQLWALALLPVGLWALSSLFDSDDADQPEPEPVDRPDIAVTLTGAAGDETLIGSDLDDALMGGGGADTLDAGGGDDVLLGSTLGADATAADLPAQPGPYGLELGSPDDQALHDDGAGDRLDGGDGKDTIYGDFGSDTAPDTLIGGAGNDLIVDVPTLVGIDTGWHTPLDGAAVIDAGQGDDTIWASACDTITTGDGADVIHLGSSYTVDQGSMAAHHVISTPLALKGAVTVIDFTPGVDRIEIDAASVLTRRIFDGVTYDRTSYTDYDVMLRQEAGKTIVSIGQPGGAYSDAMLLEGVTGLTRDDILLTLPPSVAPGDSLADGSVAADHLTGTPGADALDGALGNDTLSSLINGAGGLTDDGQADTLIGGWDEDVLIGNGGDVLEGGKGDDVLVHVASADGADAPGATLIAGEGHDVVYASGNDTVDLGGGQEMNSLVLADPRLCTTDDLLNTHLLVRNFGSNPDMEFGNFVFADLSRDDVVTDPVTGVPTTVTVTLTPHLREEGGNMILSLTNDATGTVYDKVITFEGATGLTVESVIGEPTSQRPLTLPALS